jgi:hypothetical protein
LIKLALRSIANRPKRDARLANTPADGWESASTARTNYWLDGDVGGEFTTPTAEIQPGALTVCAPAPVPGTPHQ